MRKVEITDAQLRSLAKLALAMFIANRQGVDGLAELEKEAIGGFAVFHELDRDSVTHFYLSAMKTLSDAPFVFCAIHARKEYIDAVLQNPASAGEVTRFVAEGVAAVKSSMNFRTDAAQDGEPDLIL